MKVVAPVEARRQREHHLGVVERDLDRLGLRRRLRFGLTRLGGLADLTAVGLDLARRHTRLRRNGLDPGIGLLAELAPIRLGGTSRTG